VGKEVCRLGGEMIDERVQSHAKPVAELATNRALYGESARVVLVWQRVCIRKRPSVVEPSGNPVERLRRDGRLHTDQQDDTRQESPHGELLRVHLQPNPRARTPQDGSNATRVAWSPQQVRAQP